MGGACARRCPPGPFLVVGLARSGRAAALGAARARARRSRAATAARSTRAARRAGGAPASRCTRRPTASTCSHGVADARQEPGRAAGGAGRARRARARRARLGELELGWRLLPNDVIAITGSNGKTTTTELVGQIHREAGLPVAVAGNVGTALTTLAGHARPGRGRRVRGVVVPARGHGRVRARGGGAAQPHARPPRPPRHVRRLPRGEAADLRPPAARGAVAVAPAGLERRRPRRRASRSRRRWRPATATAAADVTVAGGALSWRGEPVIAVDEIRLRGAHNLENAMAAAAVTLARGVEPAAVRAALASFAGVAHRLEEVAPDRRRPLRRRLQGDQRRVRGRRHPLVRRRRPRDPRRPRQARGLRAARRRACAERGARRLPDRRGGGPAGGGARAGRRAGPRLRRPRARGRRRARAAARRARSCCSRPPARRSTSTARSRSAATTSRRSRRRAESPRLRRTRGRRAGPPGGVESRS